MEGMESVYLKRKGGHPKPGSWCSKKVSFKDYFSKYSDQLSGVFPSTKSTTKDIFHGILPDSELSNESLKSLIRLTDPNNFKMKLGNKSFLEETCQPSSPKENIPSTSKESNQSTSGKGTPSTSGKGTPSTSREGIPSSSKQQDRAASKGRVEAVVVNSSEKETNNTPAKKIGQDPINNQNTKKKERKKNVNKSEIADKLVCQSTSAEGSVPGPTKCSNTKKINKKKASIQNLYNGAVNDEVQLPKKGTSEAIEVVSQLLESLLDNLHRDPELPIDNLKTPAECFDLQSKTNGKITNKVICQRSKESITNTLTTPSTESTNDNKASMSSTSKNPQILKVLPRRRTRSSIKKPQEENQEVSMNKSEVQKPEELQTSNNCEDILSENHEETPSKEDAEGNFKPRYIRDIIREITKRGGRNRRRNLTVRGQIIVDTTRGLGKKDLIPRKNFVVSFRIHKPFCQNMGQKGIRPGKCLQEIDMLNYHTLADLRKKILCETDFQSTAGDVSNWPYTPVTTLAKDKYKSGMFYFNNTFYVDTQEGVEDYSEVIRKWAEEHCIRVGETKPMDEMKVEDLEVRLGYPYMYMHQGSCEHLLIISDARLLNEKKSLHSSDYPNLTKITRSPVYYCITCTRRAADWIVVGSDHMIQDTNFMCEVCFHSFHYKGTEKLGNFKAYRWKQRAVLFH